MLCLHQTLEFILHSQQVREGEGDLFQQGRGWGRWNVGMSEWIEWWKGHVTPTLDDHVSVNVIAVFITAYMMKWQKVLTSSALILSVCNDIVRLNVLGVLVEIIL